MKKMYGFRFGLTTDYGYIIEPFYLSEYKYENMFSEISYFENGVYTGIIDDENWDNELPTLLKNKKKYIVREAGYEISFNGELCGYLHIYDWFFGYFLFNDESKFLKVLNDCKNNELFKEIKIMDQDYVNHILDCFK